MPTPPLTEPLGGPPWPAQLAQRLANPPHTAVSATAATAALWTILAASQLAWRAGDHAPGLVRMGALDIQLVAQQGYWPLLTAAWLHPGLASTLAGVAALAWARPLETALGRSRWLGILLCGGLAGAALSAGGGIWPGVGAPAAAAAVMAARLMLWGRAGLPMPRWVGLPAPVGFGLVLSVLAATQWLQMRSIAAVFLGAAVGALAVVSAAASWGAFEDPKLSAYANAKAQWTSRWAFRSLSVALGLASLATLVSHWSEAPPWHAGAPRGWKAVQPCKDAPGFEIPIGLGPPTCRSQGGAQTAQVGQARQDLMTISAIAEPTAATATSAAPAEQERILRAHLAATTPLGMEVEATTRLPMAGAVAVLQQQTSRYAWLPRVAMLRCGRLLDIQVAVTRGAPGAWHEAAARVAASFGARCPGPN